MSGQLDLFGGQPEPEVSRRDLLMEQLKRDLSVYNGPPEFWGSAPGRQLYADRIAAIRKELGSE